MSRLRGRTRDELDEEQRRLYDAIVDSRRGSGGFELIAADGSLTGPFNAMVAEPGLGRHWTALGARLRFASSIDKRLAELAICAVGAHYRADFEVYAHAPLALAAGVDADVVEALRSGVRPSFARDDERMVFEVVGCLLRGERPADDLYRDVLGLVGERGVLELASLVGYYAALAIGLNMFDVGLPAGHDPIWSDTI